MIRHLWAAAVDLVFPRNCLLCRTYDEATAHNPLCPRCQDKIPYNHPPFCVKCSRHVQDPSSDGLCPDCRKRLPAFDFAWGFTLYEPPMPRLVQTFKFHNKTALRKTFRRIAETFLMRYPCRLGSFEGIIPVPLTPTRLRERGYNQAGILAEEISEILKIPCFMNQLERAKHSCRQSRLGEKERWTNIQGAFRIKNSLWIQNKNILLVDDLLTTGATASEAARTLKGAGAGKIGVITLSIA